MCWLAAILSLNVCHYPAPKFACLDEQPGDVMITTCAAAFRLHGKPRLQVSEGRHA